MTLPSIIPTADDERHFAKPHMLRMETKIKLRILVERAIIRRFVTDALAASYVLRIDDGEEFLPPMTTLDEVMDAIQSVDDEHIYAYPNISDAQGEGLHYTGWIHLVYGNDGYDVISDHTDTERMNKLLAGANEVAERYAP